MFLINFLQARCDSVTFESVRCNFEVDKGVWIYEARIITEGIMQIGWATKDTKFVTRGGKRGGEGIGDDEHSIAFDGFRQKIWHNAMTESQKENRRRWRPGDIIGTILDLNKKKITFYLNGKELQSEFSSKVFECSHSSGFFAAASFSRFQHCEFNFGAKPFQFQPKDEKGNPLEFESLNNYACKMKKKLFSITQK